MNPEPFDEKMEEHLKRRLLLKMQVGITKGETFPLVVAVRKLACSSSSSSINFIETQVVMHI